MRRASDPLKLLLADECPLTSRELEVLELIAEGLSNSEIAKLLSFSVGTIKGRVSRACKKLGEPTGAYAALAAIRECWISPPQRTADARSISAQLAVRLAEAETHLAAILERLEDRRPITPTQRAFLSEFLRELRTNPIDTEAQDFARQRALVLLQAVIIEANP